MAKILRWVYSFRQPLARVQEACAEGLPSFSSFCLPLSPSRVRRCLPVSLVKAISQEGVWGEVARAMHVQSQQQRFLFVVVQFNRVD